MSDRLLHQIALTLLPQVGAITAKTLVSYCGSAEAVFRASRRELLKIPGIGPGIAAGIAMTSALTKAEEELRFLEQYGVQALFYTDEKYPARLRQNADCPALLYFKGSSVDLLGARRMVAVVGTRQPTEYGRAVCEEFMEGLRAYDTVVVSGLAFGIDVTAHRKATALGMPNIAVLGHGLGKVYPNEHRSVALKLTENGGLLSEYTHHTGPDREHFPMRNRIIAGLCDALLVVETANSGGSMITAELAGQYERDIFAVPGRVRDAKSAGCNQLIRTNRARLTESAADIAAALGWDENGRSRSVQPQLFLDLSPAETALIEIIRQRPQVPIDELTPAAGHPPGELARLLLGLEFKGVVRTLPGKRYEIVG
ncbi:MAG: DNA-protecting protein DprA [Saprospiraceae bacterium]|jgi:DNA processing protein|nr:DNA-protecting protein DprA [Saprospiraceae bacterium]